MPSVNVLLTGTTLPGADPQKAAAALSQATKLSPETALALLTSGKPRLVKRGLTPEAAQALADRFGALGIATTLQTEAEPASAAPPPPPRPAPAPEMPEPPEPPVTLVKKTSRPAEPDPEAEDFNPYRAPKADMTEARPRAEGFWLDRGRVVPAGHGLQWLGDAWRLFKERPGTWIGASLLPFLLLWGILTLVELLLPSASRAGNFISTLFWPIFHGGMAIMAHAQMRGEAIGVGRVFDGFRYRGAPLLRVGLLIMLYMVVVVFVGLFLWLVCMPLLKGSSPAALLLVIVLAAVFLVALLVPPLIAGLAAPTLAAVAERGAWESLIQGYSAVNRNWRAVLVNALVVGSVPAFIGIAAAIIIPQAAKAGVSEGLTLFLVLACVPLGLFILWLYLLMPIMYYTATRDIFYEEGQA